jgi:hypothetical protein
LDVYGFPSPVEAGTVNTFTVTAKDAYGNVTPAYQGTTHFTSTDPKANLPEDYTFSAADAGTKVFGAVLNTVGTQDLTATDTANGSVTGTQAGIIVVPPPGPSRYFGLSIHGPDFLTLILGTADLNALD